MLNEVMKSGYSFELENKKITFNMIAWGDALKAQNAIHLIATNEAKNIDEGNSRLLNLALKYAVIHTDSGELENLSLENFTSQFNNVFACVELGAQFRDYVLSFLEQLPSFRKLDKQA